MEKRRFLGKEGRGGGGPDREKAWIELLLEVIAVAEGAPLFPGM